MHTGNSLAYPTHCSAHSHPAPQNHSVPTTQDADCKHCTPHTSLAARTAHTSHATHTAHCAPRTHCIHRSLRWAHTDTPTHTHTRLTPPVRVPHCRALHCSCPGTPWSRPRHSPPAPGRAPPPATHLQVGQGRVQVGRVLLQEPLLVQELAGAAPGGRLEEPVVERVLEAVVEGAEHALLGGPHGCGRVQAQTLLWRSGLMSADRVSADRPRPARRRAPSPGSPRRSPGLRSPSPGPRASASSRRGPAPRAVLPRAPPPPGWWGGSPRRRRGRGE